MKHENKSKVYVSCTVKAYTRIYEAIFGQYQLHEFKKRGYEFQ